MTRRRCHLATEQLTNILNGQFDVKNRDNDYFLVSSAMESKRKCPQQQITRCLWLTPFAQMPFGHFTNSGTLREMARPSLD